MADGPAATNDPVPWTAGDVLALQGLPGRYAHAWDEYELDGFAALFADDAELDLWAARAPLIGPAAIRALHEERVGSFRACGIQRRHRMSSIVVTPLSANEAEIRAYGEVATTDAATGLTANLPPVVYRGLATRKDGVWRIRRWVARTDAAIPPHLA